MSTAERTQVLLSLVSAGAAWWAVWLLPAGVPGPAARWRRRRRGVRRDDGPGAAPDHEVARARRSALLVAAVVTAGVLLLAPGWLAVAAVPAGVVSWRGASRLETMAARRHRELLERELPHVVDLVRAQVVTGASPEMAVQSVLGVLSPTATAELRPWVARLALGSDPASVWMGLARHEQLGRLGTTLHRASVSGAPVTEALGRLADDLRAGRRAEVQRRVRQVEVRAAGPLGACLLPAFVLLGVVPLVAGAARTLVLG